MEASFSYCCTDRCISYALNI